MAIEHIGVNPAFKASSELPNGGRDQQPAQGKHGTNGHRGPSAVDLPATGYSADIYQGESYIAEKFALAEQGKLIAARSGLWTPKAAHEMIMRAFNKSEPRNTSWIGIRKTDAPRGQYNGFAWQEEEVVPTTVRKLRTVHMILRVLDTDIQGLQNIHFGRILMQLGIGLYPNANTVDHRSGNPIAVASWLWSGVFKAGRRFPYDKTFIEDREMPHALLWLYSRFHTAGEYPNLLTGVSKGDYLEPNGAIPINIRGRAQEVSQWMTEKRKVVSVDGENKRSLGMDLRNRDALYEIGELK